MSPINQSKTDHFFEMLLEYSREPDLVSRDALEQKIWEEFDAETMASATWAVFEEFAGRSREIGDDHAAS